MRDKHSKRNTALHDALQNLAVVTGDFSLLPKQSETHDLAEQFAANLRDSDTAKLRPIDCINSTKNKHKIHQ